MSKPKVLIFDFETAPLEILAWGQRDQFIQPEQVVKDRSVLTFSAKYLKDASGNLYGPHNKVMHYSTAGQRNLRDDKKVIAALAGLLDGADAVITQNGDSFDIPIFKGRALVNGIKPPSPFKQIDTLKMARKLGFTSNKLSSLTKALCPEFEKSVHKAFPGMSLWTEFLAGNKKAQREMRLYNNRDVEGTEAVYNKMAPFCSPVDFSLFFPDAGERVCTCGSREFSQNGVDYQKRGMYKRYKCKSCGKHFKGELIK